MRTKQIKASFAPLNMSQTTTRQTKSRPESLLRDGALELGARLAQSEGIRFDEAIGLGLTHPILPYSVRCRPERDPENSGDLEVRLSPARSPRPFELHQRALRHTILE